MAESTAGTMRLVGGDPCLDFVNTVGGRQPDARISATSPIREKLAEYADLLAWARHAGLLSESQARRLAKRASERPAEAARVLARAIALREALYRVLRALMVERRPEPDDLGALNRELAAFRASERLAIADDGLRWDTDSSNELDALLAPVCRAASALLTSGELPRLRQCAGEDCGWLFLDKSRNHSRQWCTMDDCGNLAKVRRFRARQHQA